MKDFTNLTYLQSGNPKQKTVYQLIQELKICNILSDFNPLIVGTIPIDIDLPDSDVDIICEVSSLQKFKLLLTNKFRSFHSFTCKEKIIRNENSCICRFIYKNFTFEIFGQNVPTEQQYAYRHMMIEYQILQFLPTSFQEQIILLKKQGLKTEEAFAKRLNLSGDPFEALLNFDIKSIIYNE